MIVRRLDHPAFPGEQLVVVGMVFPSPLLQGYGKPSLAVVKTVNGIKIRNLRHLVESPARRAGPVLRVRIRRPERAGARAAPPGND